MSLAFWKTINDSKHFKSPLTCKGYWFLKDVHQYTERLACPQMIQTPLGNHWNAPSCGEKGSFQQSSAGPGSPAWRQRRPPGSTGLLDTTPTVSLPLWSSPHCLRQEMISLLDTFQNKRYSTVWWRNTPMSINKRGMKTEWESGSKEVELSCLAVPYLVAAGWRCLEESPGNCLVSCSPPL